MEMAEKHSHLGVYYLFSPRFLKFFTKDNFTKKEIKVAQDHTTILPISRLLQRPKP